MGRFDRYRENLKIEGNYILSYDTKVARIDQERQELIELGNYSRTTSKHVAYAAEELNKKLVKFVSIASTEEDKDNSVNEKKPLVLLAYKYAVANKNKIKTDYADCFRVNVAEKITELRLHANGWSIEEQKGLKVDKFLATNSERRMSSGVVFAKVGKVYPSFINGQVYSERGMHTMSHAFIQENFREATDREIYSYLLEEFKYVCGGEGYEFIGRDGNTMQTVQGISDSRYVHNDVEGHWFKVITDRYTEGGIVYENGTWFSL